MARGKMDQVVIPDDYPPILSGTPPLERLRQAATVTIYTERALSEEELIKRLQGARVAINIRAYSKFNAAVLRSCPDLKMIAVLGIGTDNVDLSTASLLGIQVSNTPGYSAAAVAEHTLALMMAAARKIGEHDRELRLGRWTRMPMVQLNGKTLGVIGFGAIGRQVASLGRGIGMKVLAWTFHPAPERAMESVQFVDFDRLLSQSDVISINIRASEKTRHLISRQALEKTKPSCILVNTARASIVDTQAMFDSLKAGKLAAAGLDVFDREPLSHDDPIFTVPNLVLSPHNAGMTPEAIERGNEMVVENAISFLQGRPINLVTG